MRHQDPKTLYPGTGFATQIGRGNGEGYTVNISMPVYAGYDSYQLVFEELVSPITEEFKPQIIIRNGGSDPHFADELTNLGLTVEGFKMIGEKVRLMSSKTCDGRVIDLIASGYNKEVLPHSWLAYIAGLTGIQISLEEPVAIPKRFKEDLSLDKTKKEIREIKRLLKDFWRCL